MSGEKVLVVDDDEAIREILERGLISLGYLVETAESAANTSIALDQFKPDVVLMDVGMPGVDGITLCRNIKLASSSPIPVIIITAFDDEKTHHDAMLFGASEFIAKPFDLSEVQMKIEKLLLKNQIKKENAR